MFIKYARSEEILEVKTSSARIDWSPNAGEMISKCAAKTDEGDIEGGYLYVRARAISSRVNKNNDGWPSEELAKGYKTFIGRPVFVDHNNSNPSRTRGVIVDAKLHVDDEKTSALDPYYSTAPDNHKPPTWVEILIEVDAKTFPKLARAIRNGHIDATSMGANIDRSICSVCANEATAPSDYCDHIQKKGSTFEITADNGEKIRKRSYEDCYGVNFFEDSFVFDPADPTALNIGVGDKMVALAHDSEQAIGVGPDGGKLYPGFCEFCGDDKSGVHHTVRGNMCPACAGSATEADYPGTEPLKYASDVNSVCPECGSKDIVQDSINEGSQEPFFKCKGCGAWWHKGDIEREQEWDNEGGSRNGGQTEGVRSAAFSWFRCQVCGTSLEQNDGPCPHCGSHEITEVTDMPEQPGKRGSYDALIKIADGYHVGCRDCGEHMINIEDDSPNSLLYCPKCDRTESNLSTLAPFLEHKTADYGEGGQGVDKERVLNYEPQSDMIKAPQKVDTLKDDIECPNCRSDHLEADPDGIMRCPTCSYEQPPEGLDNPDLSQAERNDEEGLQGNKNPQDVVRAGEEDLDLKPNADSAGTRGDSFIEPIKPMQAATKDNITAGVISGMIWKRKIQTNNIAEANEILRQVTGAEEATRIEYPGGIHFGTHAAFKQEGLQATVLYPGAPQPLPIPGNAMQHFMMQMNAVKAAGLGGPGELEVKVDAPDEQMNRVLQLIHNGGNTHEASTKIGGPEDTTGLNGTYIDKTTLLKLVVDSNPGFGWNAYWIHSNGEKVHDPNITPESVEQMLSRGNLVKQAIKQQPKKKVLMPESTNQPKEQVISDQLAPVTSDRRVIKREETPDGHRTEQIIEETGTLDLENSDEPKEEKEEKSEEKNENKDTDSGESKENEEKDNKPDFLKKEREPVAASVVVAADDDDPHHEHFIQEAIKHKGRLTTACGGPPHEHMDKVKELAKGSSGLGAAARLYLNVLHPANEEKEKESSVLARLAIAEEAVDLGWIPKERKLAFIGALEDKSEDALETYREAMAFAKNASVNKQQRVAHSHSRAALPRLGSVNQNVLSNNGRANLDDVPFEAVFLPS